MRLLIRGESGAFVFHTFESNNLLAYAILSYTWHEDNS
jgi:hypothetical protein